MAADPKQELEELRRIDALQAKAAIRGPAQPATEEKSYQDYQKEMVGGMGPLNKLFTGVGSGMTNAARHMGHFLVGVDKDIPERQVTDVRTGITYTAPAKKKTDPNSFFSKEQIEEQARRDEALGNTPSGFIGQLVGESALTAPVTEVSAPLKLLRGGKVLTKALPAIKAATEGAAQGAVMADPGEVSEGAGLGAGLGAALNTLGRGAGRLVRGLVRNSSAADEVARQAANKGVPLEIPLAQAADDSGISGLVKGAYNNVLPAIPGVTNSLEKQRQALIEGVRRVSLENAAPDTLKLFSGAEQETAKTIPVLKKALDSVYDQTVKQFDYPVSGQLSKSVEQRILAAHPNMDKTNLGRAVGKFDELMTQYSNGGKLIEGENLLNVKNEMSNAIRQSKGAEKAALIAAQDEIDSIIETKLKTQAPELLEQYKNVSGPYKNFLAVSKAAEKAKVDGGDFNPSQLARSARQGSENYLLGQVANQVVGKKMAASQLNKTLAGSALGALAYGVGFPAAAATWLGAQTLARPTTQRMLMGKTWYQKMLAEKLRNHPELVEQLGEGARRGVITEAVEGDE